MDVRFPIHKVLLVEDRRVIVVYPRTTGTNSSVNRNKTADLNRIAASDLAVQRPFHEMFVDATSADR